MANSIDETPNTVATNALNAIPFGSVIGAPLSACIEAQTKAARSSWEFIKEVGLMESEDGNKKAVYVSFEYRRNGKITTLNVPLLTIVPIPYIAIKDIDIAFKASISASSSSYTENKQSTAVDFGTKVSGGFNYGFAHAKMEMSINVSSKKDSTSTRDSKYSVEYTMDVAVKAGQDDMPAGMSKVLEILNESIDSVPKGGELQLSEQEVTLNGGQAGLYITYKNEEGYYDPNAVSLMDGNGRVVNKTDYSLIIDDPGVVCIVKKEGTYTVKAGSLVKTLQVNAGQ
ncbi:MAG: DUF2589 domain-containing protein [Bacteroidales bacterium]|nr:DUF2589 domain-containing protein [Bacteroidales bacterium]